MGWGRGGGGEVGQSQLTNDLLCLEGSDFVEMFENHFPTGQLSIQPKGFRELIKEVYLCGFFLILEV